MCVCINQNILFSNSSVVVDVDVGVCMCVCINQNIHFSYSSVVVVDMGVGVSVHVCEYV